MAVVEFDATPAEEVRAHRKTFITFERLVLFAVLHITLTLGCLALAFVGHAPLFAFLLGCLGRDKSPLIRLAASRATICS